MGAKAQPKLLKRINLPAIIRRIYKKMERTK